MFFKILVVLFGVIISSTVLNAQSGNVSEQSVDKVYGQPFSDDFPEAARVPLRKEAEKRHSNLSDDDFTFSIKTGEKIIGKIIHEEWDYWMVKSSDGLRIRIYKDSAQITGQNHRATKKEQAEINKEAMNDYKVHMAKDPKNYKLIGAASIGNIEQIRQLISEGADLNALSGITGMEQTPLTAAANKGQIEAVKVLANSGADINAPGFMGWPPIAHAASNGYIDIVKYLIDKGANTNPSLPKEFGSLLQISERYPDIVTVLKNAGSK